MGMMGMIDAAKMGKEATMELHQLNKNLERIAKALETRNQIRNLNQSAEKKGEQK